MRVDVFIFDIVAKVAKYDKARYLVWYLPKLRGVTADKIFEW